MSPQFSEEQGWYRESSIYSPSTYSPQFGSRILMRDVHPTVRKTDIVVAQLPGILPDIAQAKWCFYRWPKGHHLEGREIYNSDRAAWFDMGTGWFNKQVRTVKRLVWQGLTP